MSTPAPQRILITLPALDRRSQSHHGFTLIELLVVISIIALLVSILLPALGKVKQTGQQVQCASNLRQLGQGLFIYQHDSNGFIYPGFYVDASFPRRSVWGSVIDQKMGGRGLSFNWDAVTLSVFACPTNRPDALAQLSSGTAVSSAQVGYVANRITSWSGDVGVDFVSPARRSSQFRQASEQVYLAETNDENYVVHPANWIPFQRFFGHPNFSGNVLFLDGHAKPCAYPTHPIYEATVAAYAKHWGLEF